MFTTFRYQNIAISVWAAILIFVSPALADGSKPEAGEVPQSVLNLDLCTLAYQLYHQSLCLPLDPWYDMMSRVGSDRRNNICRFTHDYAAKLGSSTANNGSLGQGFYSGPNAARGWSDTNLNLDPILTNYKYIDAKLPTFNRDGEQFLAVLAPNYITKNIKTIDGVRYRTKPTGFPCSDTERFQIREYPSGADHLIVFEGGTGIVGTTQPSWSPMGFVLMKKTATGYDAHIVFRGSRSGSSLSKTVWKAQDAIGDAKGNPDWITDLGGTKQIEQPLISKVGKVTKGFAEALPTMLGPITACCKYLEQNYPAPEHIYVTGHSLGAGLGSQFVSAVLQGNYGDQLRQEVKSWPWNNTILMAYAQPIPGDPTWAASFDKVAPTAQHYWVEGDSVVEATSGLIVGLLIDKGEHAGVQKKLSTVANCKDNPHEVFVIRAAMLRDLGSSSGSNQALAQQLGQQNTWGYYQTLSKMLAGQPLSYVYPGAPAPNIVTEANLRQVLQNSNFNSEFAGWLEQVYARMIADKDSYIGFKFQSTLDERQKLVLDIAGRMRQPATNDPAQEVNGLVNESTLIDGNLGLTNEEQWIYCGTILSRLQKAPLTVNDLLTRPMIKTCFESKFDE
ncbi:hypothetical protein KBF38_00665 [bacterium]|nr:hypothetical protein [bacterium]